MSGNLSPNADERATLPTNPAAVQSRQDGTNKSAAQDAISQTAAQPANDSGSAINDDDVFFQTSTAPGFGRGKKKKPARRVVAPVAASVERLSADNEQEELEGTVEPAYDAPKYQTISKACRQEFALCDDALYGLAGRIVKKLDPETESHPAAILIEILIGFGSIIGRTAHFVVEDRAHYGNLFVVIVGETSAGRKGTAHGRVEKIFSKVDETGSPCGRRRVCLQARD